MSPAGCLSFFFSFSFSLSFLFLFLFNFHPRHSLFTLSALLILFSIFCPVPIRCAPGLPAVPPCSLSRRFKLGPCRHNSPKSNKPIIALNNSGLLYLLLIILHHLQRKSHRHCQSQTRTRTPPRLHGHRHSMPHSLPASWFCPSRRPATVF